MSWIERIRNVMLPSPSSYSLPAIKKLLKASREDWPFINSALRDAVAKRCILKVGGSFGLGPSWSSSSSSSSSSDLLVVNEISLEQRLADGSNTAIDLTESQFDIDTRNIQLMKAGLVDSATSANAITLVLKINAIVLSSKSCLLAPTIVERIKGMLNLSSLLNDELTKALAVLASTCQNRLNMLQEEYRGIETKCSTLQDIKTNVQSKR